MRGYFRAAFGRRPRRYLTEVRLRQAAEFLRTTRLGIKQIAQAVGYRNIAAFGRTFKWAFGLIRPRWGSHRPPVPTHDPP